MQGVNRVAVGEIELDHVRARHDKSPVASRNGSEEASAAYNEEDV